MSNPLDTLLPPDIRRRLGELAEEEQAEQAWRQLWASRLGKLFALLVVAFLAYLMHLGLRG